MDSVGLQNLIMHMHQPTYLSHTGTKCAICCYATMPVHCCASKPVAFNVITLITRVVVMVNQSSNKLLPPWNGCE